MRYPTGGMDQSIDRYLKKIYYNPSTPASFSSHLKLWAYVKTRADKPQKLSRAKLKSWLKMQDTDSVFKISRKKFPRERIIVSAIDMAWDVDLADMGGHKEYNDGYAFILVAIDLLSRYCWVRPLKTKKASEVKDAFSDIFETDKRIPIRLRSDKGGEFNNRILRNFLLKKKVHFFTTFSDAKANYSERMIRTLKNRIYKFMYERQTYRYIDVLQDIASSYNNTIHSSIKMAPSQVTEQNDLDIYIKFYMPHVNKLAKKPVKFSFNIGDLVRVSYNKGKFAKSYFEQYSEEIFTIRYRIHSFPPRYLLADFLGENIDGSFYEQELVKVDPDEKREFKIQNIVKYRKRGKRREALVKWYGYGDKFNSYIPAAQIKQYKSATAN